MPSRRLLAIEGVVCAIFYIGSPTEVNRPLNASHAVLQTYICPCRKGGIIDDPIVRQIASTESAPKFRLISLHPHVELAVDLSLPDNAADDYERF